MNSASDETQAMHDATNVLHPQRTIVELKELRALTGNDDGAQRVAFTPTWANAREWLKGKMAELPVESRTDAVGNVSVTWERIWQIEPVLFDPTLIDLCDEAILETCGTSHRMPSGPLQDAAEVSRAGIPTVMMFVQSLHGISHNKIEDTREEHLELCVKAFDHLALKTMEWIARNSQT